MIDPSAEDPQSVVERFLQAMRETGRSDIRKLPIAVVVSKVDAIDAGDGIVPGDEGEKVSAWLEAHGGGNLVRLLAAEFGSCRFFAVSSLGRVPDPSDSSAFSPNGTLEPFFWLLSANKIAMNGKATETAATVTDELSAKDRAQRVVPWPHTPLLAPRPRSAGGYAAGVAVAIAIFAGVVALAVALSKNNTGEALASANTGSTGGHTSGSTGNTTGNTAAPPATPARRATRPATPATPARVDRATARPPRLTTAMHFPSTIPLAGTSRLQRSLQSWGGTDTTIVPATGAYTLVRIDVKRSGGGATPAPQRSQSLRPSRRRLVPATRTPLGDDRWLPCPRLAVRGHRRQRITVEEEDDFIVASNGANVAVLTQAPVSHYQA